MDVGPESREQLRKDLKTCGADLTFFEDADLDILWRNRYRSVRALHDATREGLTAAGLPPALIDHILKLQAAAAGLSVGIAAGAEDDFSTTYLTKKLTPFGPTCLWDGPAVLRQRLAEVVCLPLPSADVKRLCQQHGELLNQLVSLEDLPATSRPRQLSVHVQHILGLLPLSGTSEMYTAFLTLIVVESTLQFISHYLPGVVPLDMDRNTTDASGATAKKLRPDFLCWVKGVLLFKGEEKAQFHQMTEAVAELTSKLSDVWLEDLRQPPHVQAPCMLAYAAAGKKIQFFSIRKGPTPTAEDISPVMDLSTVLGRHQALTATCNIWRLLAGFGQTNLTASVALGQELKSDDGKSSVILLPGYVRKCIRSFEAVHARHTSFELLLELYSKLSRPEHQRAIIQACKGPQLRDDVYVVYLAPVGEPCKTPPASEAEAARAVHGVLGGLAALHSEGFVHRDVRWPNVIRLPAEDRWLLIDLEHAGKENCDCSQDALRLSLWRGRILEEGGRYTAASDLRMVGEQLMGCLPFALRESGRNLLQQLMDGTASAAEARQHPWFSEAR